MSDSVDRVFVHALNTVKRIPRTGTARPPASERLKLYGLYKQSMEGDVEGVMDRPVGNTADVYAECEKWDAWFAQRGLSRTEAKRRYISTLIETMHRYASQTPEARELASELEFVWDQIKSNTSASVASSSMSSSSSNSAKNPVGVLPLSQSQTQSRYGSIGGRLARSEYDHLVATARGNSKLRVLSPVSQPEEVYRRGSHGHLGSRPMRDDMEDAEEEEEEEEEYAEAQDNLSEDNDDNDDDTHDDHHEADVNRSRGSHAISESSDARESSPQHSSPGRQNRRWRRRVEQALTKMTAEIAAVREQMEARALAHRRRTSVWAWLKWLVWGAFRQILWDLTLLGMMLIWMRMRGDRRLEEKLRMGWSELKSRLARWRGLRITFP
ncbi:hypothetical protein EYZ11_004188 [Aspergillus tanneri]|uniref:ACB domain-containing protein n=1 Tax=Aspergillus tanneri TaxID=1220188 RepID=A0A4S3JL56_9EURO|nr:uncharacterized protein ATNIH1004_000775 [Aspergillus tanneri]KAA8651877.1 hypothetical protein ATNIH1004_000775 [Aspergillus tanneri]THC96329.1 hypothetical protein EYZ11_004188 [Aspergillus tanneri]